MLPSGSLREQVTLQSRQVTRDALGGDVTSWADECRVWAAIETPTGREAVVAQQLAAVVSHSVVMRPRGDVRPDWRVLWGDRVLSIETVLADPAREKTTLLCSEGLVQADL